jgi:Bacterial shufflon protein, N-terminal constant region
MPPLLGVFMAIALSGMMLATLAPWVRKASANVQTAVVATQAQVISQAATHYIKDKGAALAITSTPTVPTTITMDQLKQANYLPAGVATVNSFQQTWQVQVSQPQPGQLQSFLLSTGGRAIQDRSQLVEIAGQATGQGNLGGFVPYPNQGGDPTMRADTAVGAGGTFRQPLAAFSNPGSGHLAIMLAVADASADNGYLYRVDMKPGRPDLNAMQTNFSLTDKQGVAHDANGANAYLLANAAGMTSDQGGAIELGDISGTHPGQAPYIDFHLGGKGAQDFNVRLQNEADGRLAITGANGRGSARVEGTMQLGNIATPGTGCAPNGAMAANTDGSGQVLSCQYGSWMPIGGRWLRYGYYAVANGWWVPAPTCPNGGAMKIQVTLQSFTVNNTATVNPGPAVWVGNGWTVPITDGVGNGIPGAQAIAATYCAY